MKKKGTVFRKDIGRDEPPLLYETERGVHPLLDKYNEDIIINSSCGPLKTKF